MAKIEFEMLAGVSGRLWCFNGETGEAACHVCSGGGKVPRSIREASPSFIYYFIVFKNPALRF